MSVFGKLLRTLGLAAEAPELPSATAQPLSRFDRFAAANREAFALIGTLPEPEIVAEERRLAAEVTDILLSLKPFMVEGVSRLEIQEHVLQQLDSRQLLPALVGYKGYPAAVPVSVNAELISCLPSEKLLPASALVKVEVVVSSHKGYGAQSWTFATPGASAEQLRLLSCAKDALEQGLQQVRSGEPLGAIGGAIQDVLDVQGFSAVAEYCGYGMGRQRIQAPQVLGYRVKDNSELMVAGQVLNIQVLAKAGSAHVRVMPNGWNVVAGDRCDGVVVSAMVRVTEEGVERFSRFVD
ncbi:M24 family metallopeptidase [Pseudomonas protegens]|uniref:M24 family metallopeptidase n=1 Tax=Pseudomonas protegens TaxID=380021 RepID=A0A7G7X7F9_9PSED|nr:M24 family metallopeptidase [Pseudomonas protegens]QNH75904.1 M24 family metallopeptidase [Pseudomonas protegens]QNL05098.1 M24 family metallopeptidase [Pseudomonas protegens]